MFNKTVCDLLLVLTICQMLEYLRTKRAHLHVDPSVFAATIVDYFINPLFLLFFCLNNANLMSVSV